MQAANVVSNSREKNSIKDVRFGTFWQAFFESLGGPTMLGTPHTICIQILVDEQGNHEEFTGRKNFTKSMDDFFIGMNNVVPSVLESRDLKFVYTSAKKLDTEGKLRDFTRKGVSRKNVEKSK